MKRGAVKKVMEEAVQAAAQQQVEIPADHEASVKLPLQAWGLVLTLVRKGPMEQVEGVVGAINGQLTEALKQYAKDKAAA